MIQAAIWMNDLADSMVLVVLIFAAAVIFIAGAILIWLRHRHRRRQPEWIEGFSGRPVSETDGGKLYAIVGKRNTCPDCGHHGFYAGPEGGMSTNIYCKNWRCKSAFNVTPFGGGDGICERIGKTNARYPDEPPPEPIQQ